MRVRVLNTENLSQSHGALCHPPLTFPLLPSGACVSVTKVSTCQQIHARQLYSTPPLHRVPPGPPALKLSVRHCWRRRLAHLCHQCVRCLFGRAALVGFFVNLTPCARSTVFPQFRSQGTSQVCSQPLRSPQVPAFVHTSLERFSRASEVSDGCLRS